MKIILGFILVTSFAFSVTYATTSEEVSQKTKEAAASALDFSREQKDKVQAEMEESLATMKSKIAELKLQADKKAGSAKVAAKKEIADLERRQARVSARLDKFKKSSGKAWKNMKTGFNEAFEKLSKAYDKAKENYK